MGQSKTSESPARVKDYCSYLLVPLGATLAVCLFFHRLLFTDHLPFYRDFFYYSYPNILFWRDTLLAGQIPFWNPHIQLGVPFLADPTTATLYPLHFPFLLFDFSLAVKFFFALHFFLALLFAYYCGRLFGISKSGSILVALVFAFSGYLLGVSNYFTKIRGLIWVPLLFGVWQKHFRSLRPWSLIAPGLVMALMVYSGHLYALVLTGFFLAIYTFFFQRHRLLFKVKKLLILAAIGLLLSTPQWVPTLHYMPDSIRQQTMADKEAKMWSLSPRRLTELTVPGLFGLRPFQPTTFQASESSYWVHSIYLGLPAFLLAFLAWREKRHQKSTYFFYFLAGTGLLLALGGNLPFFDSFRNVVPFMDRFRYPEKFFFWTTFALAMLAGRGFDTLVASLPDRVSLTKGLALFSAAVILSLALLPLPPVQGSSPDANALSIWSLVRFFLLFNIVLAFCYLGRRYAWVVPLFLGVVAADLYQINREEIPLIPSRVYQTSPETLKDLPSRKPGGYRIHRHPTREAFALPPRGGPEVREKILELGKETMYVNVPSMVYGFSSFHGMCPASLHRWKLYLQGFPSSRGPEAITLGGVHYVMSPLEKNRAPVKWAQLVQSYPSLNAGWYKVKSPVSRLRFYDRVRPVENLAQAQKVFPHLDWRKEVVIEGPPPGESLAKSGQAKYIRYEANEQTIEVETDRASCLVITDSFHQGWSAKVEGEKIPLYPAHLLYRAVYLPPGKHRLVLTYRPPGWTWSLVVFFLSLFGLTAWLVIDKCYSSSQESHSSP